MKIIKVTPQGFCKGVLRAIHLAKKAKKENPNTPIYILGMLVHNQYIVDALSQIGIYTVDDKTKTRLELLDSINEGIVIFTAHGVSDQVIQKAKEKKLQYIDASCVDVLHTRNLILQYLQNEYHVLYIGKQNHPEAEAMCGLSENVHLIRNVEDVIHLPNYSKLFLTNQTTMSKYDTLKLMYQIQKRFPHVEVAEEICDATSKRQEAIFSLENINLLYVVGDQHSNNSNKLAEIGKQNNIPQVYLINDVSQIEDQHLHNVETIAITSGASTPTYITKQVINYLENYEISKEKPKIDYSKII